MLDTFKRRRGTNDMLRTMMTLPSILAVTFAMIPLFVSAGCSNKNKPIVPLAQIVLPPTPSTMVGPELNARVTNEFATLVSGPTENMFPASIGLIRVAPTDTGELALDGSAPLAMKPLNQLLDLVSLFDDVWQVSELFPVTYPTRTDRRLPAAELVRYARSDGARLCLIYSVARYEWTDSSTVEVHGALYDAATGTLISRMHANSRVIALSDDVRPPVQPEDRVELDLRHIDPWYIAQDRFREHVRDCVLRLIERDQKTYDPYGRNAPTASGGVSK
jgi:hypothetical protein